MIKAIREEWYMSHWQTQLSKIIKRSVWGSGQHLEIANIPGTANEDYVVAVVENASDQIWQDKHPLSTKKEWHDGYLAYLVEHGYFDVVYAKRVQILVLEQNSPFKQSIMKTALKVGERVDTSELQIPEEEAETFMDQLGAVIPPGVFRLTRKDNATLKECDTAWSRMTWMVNALEQCTHSFASGGTMLGRILDEGVQKGKYSLFENPRSYTVIVPRGKLDRFSAGEIYDQDTLDAAIEAWEIEDAPAAAILSPAMRTKAITIAKEALKEGLVLICLATISGNDELVLEPIPGNNTLPSNDIREAMSHPIFSAPKSAAATLQIAVRQMKKTEQVIANQCIGQAIGKNSILLYSATNVPKFHTWDMNDPRTQNRNPFTMTLQEVENLPEIMSVLPQCALIPVTPCVTTSHVLQRNESEAEAFHEADGLNQVTPETGRRRSRSGERNGEKREPPRKSSVERAAKDCTGRTRSEPTKEKEK